MSLSAFLSSLALSNYQAVFSNKGFTDLDQFLGLSDADLDAALTSCQAALCRGRRGTTAPKAHDSHVQARS